MTKSQPKLTDFVFDDDTDDSDDDLVEFRKNIGKVSGGKAPSGNSDDESVEEEGEGDEEGEAEEEEEESSEASDDSESEESESEKAEREKANSVINNKLGKLSSLLTKDESSESEEDDQEEEEESEEESSDDADEDFSSKRTTEVISVDPKIASEKDKDSSNNDSDQKGNAGNKRKFDDSLGKDGGASTETVPSLNEEDERAKYRKNLSKLSVQEILKIKESLGDKLFNSKWSGNTKAPVTKKQALVEFKRENKNRPQEISSKIKPRRRRMKPVVEQTKRDPRFDPLCGEFDKNEFRKQYNFVNQFKSNELKQLKSQLKESRGEERSKIKYLVQRMENQERSREIIEEKKKKAKKDLLEMKEKVQAGEQIFYKNKKTLKEEELVEQYEKLKKTGKVDKYIQKRSKKNTTKDRKLYGDII